MKPRTGLLLNSQQTKTRFCVDEHTGHSFLDINNLLLHLDFIRAPTFTFAAPARLWSSGVVICHRRRCSLSPTYLITGGISKKVRTIELSDLLSMSRKKAHCVAGKCP